METNPNLLSVDIQVDSIAHSHLKETAMWAKLLAIVGFVLSVLLGIISLFIGTIMENTYGKFGAAAGSGIMLTLVYLVIAVIYFVMSLFLFRFATKMKTALQTIDQENFNVSLYNLKLVYRITGIIVVIYLAILVLALVIGVAAAAFAA